MKEVLEFLTENKVFFLATVDGDLPQVRPMGFVMEWEGKLAFCTSNRKEMCKQMAANPKIAISCVDKDGNTLRVTGKVVFATTAESQRKALEVMPSLGALYSVGDGKFEIFCLEEGKAACSTMAGECKELEL